MTLPRARVPRRPTKGCAAARHDRFLPAGWEQLSTVISFLSPQTCLTSAIQSPATRRGPKSAKTSWATSIASAKLAGGTDSVTKVRPPQPRDKAQGCQCWDLPVGPPRGPHAGEPVSSPCLNSPCAPAGDTAVLACSGRDGSGAAWRSPRSALGGSPMPASLHSAPGRGGRRWAGRAPSGPHQSHPKSENV